MHPRSITVFVRHMLLRLAEVGRRSCRRSIVYIVLYKYSIILRSIVLYPRFDYRV